MCVWRQRDLPGVPKYFLETVVSVIRACSRCGQKNRIPPARLADMGRCGACKAELTPISEPLQVDNESFDTVVRGASVPVLVDFWAPWCGPCRMAAPEVARVASEMAGKAVVLKVNTEEHPNLAARFRVQGIPNFVVFFHGRPVMQKTGLADCEQMKNWLLAAASTSAA